MKAIIDGRIPLTQSTIEKITRVMCETAPIYPRDFLRFIEKMPLQPEPEIFTKSDEFEARAHTQCPPPSVHSALNATDRCALCVCCRH